jgi:type IV pilus assembly protein PilN
MIKVNLLKEPKADTAPATVRRSLMPEVNRMGLLASLLILVCFGAVGWTWWYANHLQDLATQELSANRAELDRLQALRKLADSLEKQKKDLDARIGIIEKLKNNQTGPVRLLNVLIAGIPEEPTLWFDLLTQKENQIHLEGYALTAEIIPEFIAKLKESGFFQTIDIEYYMEEAQAVKFSLNCVIAELNKTS